MLRVSVYSLALVFLMAGFTRADDQNKQNAAKDKGKQQKATITKVDQKNHSITIKMKNKEGKDVEKTFKLTEDVEYLDSTGRVATLDIFRSGDDVLVIEREGKLVQVQHNKGKTKASSGANQEEKKPVNK